MAHYDVDLFVIGAGSGGVRAARIAAAYGAKVTIAEEFRVGGTCVIRGCVPKKLMVYASRYADEFERRGRVRLDGAQDPRSIGRSLWAPRRRRSRGSPPSIAPISEKSGVTLIEDRAVVEGANEIRLAGGGRPFSAKYILVATGGHPVLVPPVPGLEHAITSNEIFDLPDLPKRILIVGGGYIAVEFGSLLARLGSAVTLAMRGDNILRGFDEDLRIGLRDAMVQAGISFQICDAADRDRENCPQD